MVTNRIDSKGMWTEGPGDGSSSLKIDHVANTNKSILAADASGFVDNANIAQKTRYEYYEHLDGTQIFGETGSQVMINGDKDRVAGGLSTWNITSSIFFPEGIGRVYTIRFDALITPVGGNPILHMDFDVSGSNFSLEWGRHHQSSEELIRSSETHQHVHATFSVFADEALFVSGGLIKGRSSAGEIEIHSASLMIKEG